MNWGPLTSARVFVHQAAGRLAPCSSPCAGARGCWSRRRAWLAGRPLSRCCGCSRATAARASTADPASLAWATAALVPAPARSSPRLTPVHQAAGSIPGPVPEGGRARQRVAGAAWAPATATARRLRSSGCRGRRWCPTGGKQWWGTRFRRCGSWWARRPWCCSCAWVGWAGLLGWAGLGGWVGGFG